MSEVSGIEEQTGIIFDCPCEDGYKYLIIIVNTRRWGWCVGKEKLGAMGHPLVAYANTPEIDLHSNIIITCTFCRTKMSRDDIDKAVPIINSWVGQREYRNYPFEE